MRAAVRRAKRRDTCHTTVDSSAAINSAMPSSRATGCHHGFCVEYSQTLKPEDVGLSAQGKSKRAGK